MQAVRLTVVPGHVLSAEEQMEVLKQRLDEMEILTTRDVTEMALLTEQLLLLRNQQKRAA